MNISETIVAELKPKILTGNKGFSSDKCINFKKEVEREIDKGYDF